MLTKGCVMFTSWYNFVKVTTGYLLTQDSRIYLIMGGGCWWIAWLDCMLLFPSHTSSYRRLPSPTSSSWDDCNAPLFVVSVSANCDVDEDVAVVVPVFVAPSPKIRSIAALYCVILVDRRKKSHSCFVQYLEKEIRKMTTSKKQQ